ncbi:MAG: hypothetical protein K5650_02975 [Bacteroidales bacterium]|nr:hypothetical protein [Bacteroidales bacterium]
MAGNENIFSALDLMIQKNDVITKSLDFKYPQCILELTDSYIARRCINIHKMFVTIRGLLEYSNDECSINSLLRVVADHTATLILIYESPTIEEVSLRQYLSFADGVNERIKALESSEIGKNSPILEELYKERKKDIEYVRANPLYKENTQIIDKFIEKYQWKYRDFNSTSKYSWTDLYREKLNMPNDYIQYLSQYVHGLASSTNIQDEEISRATMITLATLICMKFSYFLWRATNSIPSDAETDFLQSLIKMFDTTPKQN